MVQVDQFTTDDGQGYRSSQKRSPLRSISSRKASCHSSLSGADGLDIRLCRKGLIELLQSSSASHKCLLNCTCIQAGVSEVARTRASSTEVLKSCVRSHHSLDVCMDGHCAFGPPGDPTVQRHPQCLFFLERSAPLPSESFSKDIQRNEALAQMQPQSSKKLSSPDDSGVQGPGDSGTNG